MIGERKCPWCGSTNVDYDTVDIGIGFEKCGPTICNDCGAYEDMNIPRTPVGGETEDELKEIATGWCKGASAPIPQSIDTPEDWWNTVKAYKGQLLETIKMSGGDRPQKTRLVSNEEPFPFTDMEEKICAEFDDPQNRDMVTLTGQFIHGIDSRNWEMVHNVLSTVFFKAPDHQSIHKRPAWGVLCDLCSETWVFHDEEMRQQEAIPVE